MKRSCWNSRSSIIGVLIFSIISPPAQSSELLSETTVAISVPVHQAIHSITSERIMLHVSQLCAPKMAGRDAVTAGARVAADYLAEQFRSIGLHPGGSAASYFQTFTQAS